MRQWNSQHREQIRAYNKRYKIDHPDRYKNSYLKCMYGITMEEYKHLYEQQNGVCAICKQPETTKHKSGQIRGLAVDHCHESQQVRGLLCTRCNTAVGLLMESKDIALSLIQYLDRIS